MISPFLPGSAKIGSDNGGSGLRPPAGLKNLAVMANEPASEDQTLDKIYRDRLLELFREPIGASPPPPAAKRGWARNRTCGDEVTFSVLPGADGTVIGCWQDTAGCAISTATASLLAQSLVDRSPGEAAELLDRVRKMVATGAEDIPGEEISILRTVHGLPSRHECVGVALDAAERALAPCEEEGKS